MSNKQPGEGNIKDIGDNHSVQHMDHSTYRQFLRYIYLCVRFNRIPSIFFH
jgi:hypothetical protein